MTLTERENFSARAPAVGNGVEECWMDLDGARMRYLHARIPVLANEARSAAPSGRNGTSTAGSGPPLILLHGLLGYSFSWRYTIPAVAPYATVYAPDLMGAGFSDRPPGLDYSMRGTALRVLRFIERLGITSFDLLGTSHGGAVAMMAAAESLAGNFNMRVRRLVLVAPVNPYSAHGRLLAPFAASYLGSSLFRFGVAHMSFLFPYFHARLYANRRKIPLGTLAGYVAPLMKPGLFEHALSIVRTWTEDLIELKKTLPSLAGVPTLLMWGSKDPAVYASSAAALAKYFPKSKLVIFPGIGHLPYEECPDEFNRTLIQFLTSETVPA